EVQQAAEIPIASASCASAGVRVTVITHIVSRDVNRRVGLGDAVMDGATGTVVVRVGVTAVKAPRIARVIPCVLMTRTVEIEQSAEIAVAPGRCASSH